MDVEKRIFQLERANRRLLAGVTVLAILMVSTVTLAMNPQTSGAVYLYDSGHIVRASLAMSSDSPSMPGLWINDVDGRQRLFLGLNQKGEPSLYFYD